jgi:hypothetical protein
MTATVGAVSWRADLVAGWLELGEGLVEEGCKGGAWRGSWEKGGGVQCLEREDAGTSPQYCLRCLLKLHAYGVAPWHCVLVVGRLWAGTLCPLQEGHGHPQLVSSSGLPW